MSDVAPVEAAVMVMPRWLGRVDARVRVVRPDGSPQVVATRGGRCVVGPQAPSNQLGRVGAIVAVNRETVTVHLDGEARPRNFQHDDLDPE